MHPFRGVKGVQIEVSSLDYVLGSETSAAMRLRGRSEVYESMKVNLAWAMLLSCAVVEYASV